MLESHIERRMGEMVTRRGGLYYKFVSPGQPGVPDRIIVVPGGQCVFVELKTEVGRLSNIQKWQIERMKKMGLDVRKVSGWEQARALVEELFPDGIKVERSETSAEDTAYRRREACNAMQAEDKGGKTDGTVSVSASRRKVDCGS